MPVYWNGNEITGPRGPAGPDGNPIGSVISYLGTSAPNDYLICDGREYHLSDYPDLAEFFRTQFGAANHFGGDGETTFAVPDLRNLFLRGYHGEAVETLSGEVGQRQEATYIPYAKYGYNDIAAPSIGGEWNLPANADTETGMLNYDVHSRTRFVGEWQMPYGYTTRPVNAAVLYCIKAAESIPAEEVYSTEETRIGTWIDGKPVFRRVWQVEVSQALGETALFTLDFSMEQMIRQTAIVAANGKLSFRSLPLVNTGGASGFDTVTGNGYVLITGPGHSSRPNTVLLKMPVASWAGTLTLILEYTKTEGQEG